MGGYVTKTLQEINLTLHLYQRQLHNVEECILLYQLYLQRSQMQLRTSHTSNSHDQLHSEEQFYNGKNKRYKITIITPVLSISSLYNHHHCHQYCHHCHHHHCQHHQNHHDHCCYYYCQHTNFSMTFGLTTAIQYKDQSSAGVCCSDPSTDVGWLTTVQRGQDRCLDVIGVHRVPFE